VFKAVIDYITSEVISLSNFVGICADVAAPLKGHKKGFKAEVRQVAPHVNFIHCIIHTHALASRDLQSHMCTVLQGVVKFMSFVKTRPLNSCLFTVLC
jgi:hypothetical protein